MRSFRRRSIALSLCVFALLLMVSSMQAQTPTLLPGSISSIAGNTPTASTTSAACPTNAQFTATDATGNGCPAVNAVIPTVVTNLAVDALGNVYVSANSSNPQIIRKIDARSGIISAYAGAFASQCASGSGQMIYGTKALQTDKTGDNCPVAYTSGFNGPVSLGTDPYGNVLIGTTGDAALNFVCNNVSPICSATQAAEQLMIAVVACNPTGATTSYPTAVTGTTVGTAGDGSQAQQFGVASCTIGIGARVYAPTADRWDNVYFMDGANGRMRVVAGVPSITVNSVVIPNPLFTALQLSTGTGMNYSSPSQGFIYPIAGGATGGTVCGGATDTGGDGCPFYQTLVNTGSTGSVVQGIVVDNDGDLIFDDGLGRLRVIYMGGTVIKGALSTNGVANPIVGYSYLLVGGGTAINYNSGNPGIVKGKNAALQSGAIQTLALDPAGNVIIGDQIQVLFYDISTGYIRRLATANGATSCNASTVGDGCPLTQSKFGVANKILPVGEDALGNLYMLDITNLLVRRVSALTLPTTAVNGTAATSTITVHAPATGSTVAVSSVAGSDFTVGTPACTTNTSSDGSVDCTASVTFAPATALGQRSDPISVATTVSSVTTTQNLAFNAGVTGSALAFDPAASPATTVLGVSTTGNTAVVQDGFGNSYVSGAQGISRINGATVTNVSATPAAYIAVDGSGNVYAAGAAASSVTKYGFSSATSSYTTSTITLPTANICTGSTTAINCAAVQIKSGPMVVDNFGYLYIADTTNKHVFKYSPVSGIGLQLTQTALNSPTAIGQDGYGNLLVIDGTTVLKIPSAGYQTTATSPTANPAVTFTTALTAPTAVTGDQGGNIYIADSGNIIARSYTGYQYTIPGIAGSGVAVDGTGNLYTTSTSVAGVTKVNRSAESNDFGTDVVTAYAGVFSNTGASVGTGFNLTDTGGNYSYLAPATPVATSAPTCTMGTTAIPAGYICNISIQFAPTATGTGAVPNLITILPTPTLGSLSLNGTKNGSTATTSTAITGNTTSLVYTTGTETTFTVTLTQSSGTPSGVVAVQIDGGTAVNYTLTTGGGSTATATVTISALSATAHTIGATYAGSSGIAGSTATPVSFSIAQASTSVSWTPGATTQQVGVAIGNGVLNATSVGSVPGAFTYTATPSGGSAGAIDASSYLAIGSYTLGVTFTPTDSVDYSSATGSGGSYGVTQASTTAPIGASQFLVAADGSGNYTTVQAAVNAVGALGGSIYIKPGTYNGLISVVQPNVSLRGLGGDPTAVVLTHSGGAFSVNPGSVYNYTAEFTAANSNGAQLPSGSTLFSGDEGSSTMVVAKGVNTGVSGSQLLPYNFYAENLSINNTYNTDMTTTTTTQVVGSVCTANAGAATNYNTLFNTSKQCASQALAIWVTGDQAIFNNVYTASLQDTVYAGSGGCGSPCTVSRQYWWRGKIAGTVDYIFGDAAAVFDHDNIYTVPHGTGINGTATIEAQNKGALTGSGSDYLSGYVFNRSTFTSQQPGMTGLEYGRPYGTYSTYIMLNSYVDQVNPTGWIEFSGDLNLPTSTYAEYNTTPYTDPAVGSPDINGVIYGGTGVYAALGGSVGAGVTGTRETTSQSPGTPMANNAIKTQMTAAQAAAYYPLAFLGTKVGAGGVGTLGAGSSAIWNPMTALAASMNAFVPSGATATLNAGGVITILMRPQTPGGGILPTGSYTLLDGSTTLASGTLDASGEAYYTTSALTAGSHSITWTYGGDANYAGSATVTPLTITVAGGPFNTTTTVAVSNASTTYGAVVTGTVTVAPTSGTGNPTGTVTVLVDSVSTGVPCTLSSGSCSFSLSGLSATTHTVTASYGGDSNNNASTTVSGTSLTVAKATLTIAAGSTSRLFGAANPNPLQYAGFGLVYGDTLGSVTTGVPSITTTATRVSPVGSYTITVAAGTLALTSSNYTLAYANGSIAVTGGAAQTIRFLKLPPFPSGGSYPLAARASSGLTVTYTITAGATHASISGSALTVNAGSTGSVITVQAAQSGNSTYSAATTVSQSFMAQ